MSSCIFCDMIRGNCSYHEIYQDEDELAILDKYPIDIGHSLVIPKKPYEKLTDMSIDEVSELFSKIPKICILFTKMGLKVSHHASKTKKNFESCI